MLAHIFDKYRTFRNVPRDNKYLKQENQRTYINGIVHSHRKTEKVFFWQIEMFDVSNTGDTAHIDTTFKLFPHMRQHGYIDILHCCNYPCLKAKPGNFYKF
jgi:hypothetical protein